MVDLNTCPPTPPLMCERSKIKSFMGRTPGIGILKSKFLTVLGNSNELLNGISNKLTLSISSSDSEFFDDDEEDLPKFDETIDYTKIDFESRRVKARRAHEEIISGRFRHPNLVPTPRLQSSKKRPNGHAKVKRSSSASSFSSSSSPSSSPSSSLSSAHQGQRSHVSSTTRSNSTESRHSWGYGRPGRAIAGARRSDLDIQRDLLKINDLLKTDAPPPPLPPQIDVQPPTADQSNSQETLHSEDAGGLAVGATAAIATPSANSMRVPPRSGLGSNSSTLTSLRDDPEVVGGEQISPSVESVSDWRHFIRSESQNSVPSWASSISLDCRSGEEPVKEFMKRFTEVLFANADAIGLELKSEFGALVRLETGRQWFTRFLLAQKLRSKRVEEMTFHSLVQHFALALFECAEAEDYAPAAILMNLCFLFYHEIEVPGCDPYREYLFTFMRQQPIWHTLRFWNAAFFDAVQTEREHRLALKQRHAERRRLKQHTKSSKSKVADQETPTLRRSSVIEDQQPQANGHADDKDSSDSTSSSHHSNAVVEAVCSPKVRDVVPESEQQPLSDVRLQECIIFRQLGAFTCNMHALGIPQDLCVEFLKKQSLSLNLPKEKTKMIKENINRMYHETELWGAKSS